MQIAPGSAPLSLAVLKALGSQAAPAAGKASAGAVATAPAGKATTPAGDLATARHMPRGSFVDLRA